MVIRRGTATTNKTTRNPGGAGGIRKEDGGPKKTQKAKESEQAREAGAAPEVVKTPPAPVQPAESEATRQVDKEVAQDFVKKQAHDPVEGAHSPLGMRMAAMMGKVDSAPTSTASTQMREKVDGGQGNLDVAAWFTGAPGKVGTPKATGEDGVSLDSSKLAHGWAHTINQAADTDDDGNIDSSSATGATVNRAGLNMSMSMTGDGVSDNVGVFVKKGHQHLSYSHAWAQPEGGAMRVGGFLGGGRSAIVGGVNAAQTRADGFTQGGGLIGVATFDRRATDLGNYEGGDESLQGKRKIQVQKNLGATGIGTAGAVMGHVTGILSAVGVGGRIAPSKGKNVTYRTHVDQEQAREIIQDGKGVAGFFRDKAIAAGVKKEPMDIPDLSDPKTLNVGDEMIVETTGGLSGGLAIGAYGVKVGAQVTMLGDFEMAVRKLEDDKVEMVVTPKQVRGIQASAAAPMILEVGKSQLHAQSLRQAFTFDLSKPEAMAAYQSALKGDLPNGLDKVKMPKTGADKKLVELVREEELPAGVDRSYLEAVDMQQKRAGGGLNWGVIHANWGLAGLAAHTAHVKEKRVVTDGDVAMTTDTRGVERKKQVLISGVESLGVFASLRRTTDFDENGRPQRAFKDLELTAQFSDDKVRGLEVNKDMIDKINTSFGTEIPHFKEKGHNQTRDVTVTRRVTRDDLASLTDFSPSELRRAANAAGAKPQALYDLVADMGSLKLARTRAMRVQSYVEKNGLAGFGALHQLLGNEGTTSNKPLRISTSSNAYTEPSTKAAELALEYNTPIAPDASNKELSKRFKAVEKALDKAEKGIRDTYDDPLLRSKEREETRERVVGARNQLRGLISLEHLSPAERGAMHKRLDAGWTTAREGRIMAALEKLDAAEADAAARAAAAAEST
jgi:hypothetical protein